MISVRDSGDTSFLYTTAQSEVHEYRTPESGEVCGGKEVTENATGSTGSHHPGPAIGRFYLQEIQYRKVVNHTDYIITLPKHKS